MKLCSACLLGLKTRYDGKSKPNREIIKLAKKQDLVPVCPEQLGGLPTPREPAEPTKDGKEIIKGDGEVKTKKGEKKTKEFKKGAKETYKIAKTLEINEAILKQKSPSCGNGKIPNGEFNNKTTKGDGLTTALLKQKGIKVISENEI